ncbi:MAG TPA: hypothetical protein VHS96_03780, partial [Bacteroidia bacterium]|nr:hypothetical protein [Bacteroidia bacterium]
AFVQHAFEMLGQSVLHKSVLFEIYRDLDIVYQYLGRHAQAYCFYAAAKKLQGSRIWAPLLEKTILQSLERQFSPTPSETDEAPKTLKSYFCVPHKSKVDGGLIDIVRDFKNMHPASAPNNELFYKMAFEREFTELIFTLRVADRAHFWEMKEAVHQLLLQKGYLPIKDYKGH